MKRNIKSILMAFLLVGLIFLLAACGSNSQGATEDPGEEAERTAVSIRVDESTIPQGVYAGEFKITQVYIWVEYNEGEPERISLTNEDLSTQSIPKLNKVGRQDIEVIHSKCRATFTVFLLDPTDVRYTLKVYGGLPIAVDGQAVKTTATDGVFEGDYARGAKVTIDWIDEDGKVFSCWKQGETTVDNQRRTVVVMTEDKEYTAFSDDLLFTVNFITYNQALNIAPIEDKKTIESEKSIIQEMQMDNYVFVGWTETEISQTQSLSGEIETNLVAFPFDIKKNTAFYAVWAPIGFSYAPVSIQMASGRKDGKQIVSYTGTLTELSIPSRNDGQDVISISKDAFSGENSKKLTSVSIPASIVDIEEGSFSNCTSVQSFYVDVANQYYSADQGTLYKNDKSVLVAYPLGRVAATYTIEPSVQAVSKYAFYNAVVGVVHMPTALSDIGDMAFNSSHIDHVDFTQLKRSKIETVGMDVFSEYLKAILVGLDDGEKAAYRDLFAKQSDIVFDRTEGNVTFNDVFMQELADGAVNVLFRLIYLDSSARTAEILGITRTVRDLELPDSLEGIGNDYLVTSVAEYAFRDCLSLQSIRMPTGLKRVCDHAFDDTPWAANLPNQSIIANNTLYKYLGADSSYTLGETIARIAEGAFRGNLFLQHVDITANSILESIGEYAFANCNNLESFSAGIAESVFLIKASLREIERYAFYGTAFTKIETHSAAAGDVGALESIGDFAFADNYYLERADINIDALRAIGSRTFFRCYAMEELSVSENDAFVSHNGILYEKQADGIALYYYPAGKMMTVFNPSYPNGQNGEHVPVIRLGDYSLYDSNIGALEFEEEVFATNVNAISIPSLVYVRFYNTVSLHDSFYSTVFNRCGAIKYVFAEGLNDIHLRNFFNNDEEAMKMATTDDTFFSLYVQNGIMYAVRKPDAPTSENPDPQAICTVVGVRRTSDYADITIPQTVVLGGTVFTRKNIGKYSIYGYNAQTLTINGIDLFEDYALQNAFSLIGLYIQETNVSDVPLIFEHSLGERFNRDLLVYVSCDPEEEDSYFDKWNGIIETFTYASPSGETFTASRNLIYGNAFIVLTYLDINNRQQTAYIQRGTVNIGEVSDVSNKKDGYSIGEWYDLNAYKNIGEKTVVLLQDGMNIPYNMVLDCEWVADTYELLFYVPKKVTLLFDSVLDSIGEEYNTYRKTIKFGSDYDFNVSDQESNAYNFNGWIVEGTQIPIRGTWSITSQTMRAELHIARSERDYRIEYDRSGIDQIDVNYTIVHYGKGYWLTIPKKNGYKFKGWKIQDITGVDFRITDENGASLTEWKIVRDDSVTAYPIWEADEIDVTLILTQDDHGNDIEYGKAKILFGSDDYVLLFDKTSLNTQAQNSIEDKVDFFAGWKDIDGKIYTDSNGLAIATWDKYTESVLYAIWPLFVNEGDDLKSILENNPQASIVLEADINLQEMIDIDYQGVLNGKDHTGKNHTIYLQTETNDANVGLFRKNSGTIKNIVLEITSSANVTANVAEDIYIGTVCAINDGILEDISIRLNAFEVSVAAQDGNVLVGGATAVNHGSAKNITVLVECFQVEYTTSDARLYVGTAAGENTGIMHFSLLNIQSFDVLIDGAVYDEEDAQSGTVVAGSVIGRNNDVNGGIVEGICQYLAQSANEFFGSIDRRFGLFEGGNADNLSFSRAN